MVEVVCLFVADGFYGGGVGDLFCCWGMRGGRGWGDNIEWGDRGMMGEEILMHKCDDCHWELYLEVYTRCF